MTHGNSDANVPPEPDASHEPDAPHEPAAESGGERATPFFCPYCGDEDLRPHGAAGGNWRCRACARVFSLKFLGLEVSTP